MSSANGIIHSIIKQPIRYGSLISFLLIEKEMRNRSCTRCVKRTSKRPSRARRISRIKRRICSRKAKSKNTDVNTKKTDKTDANTKKTDKTDANTKKTIILSTTPTIVGSSIKKQLGVVCTGSDCKDANANLMSSDSPGTALANLQKLAAAKGGDAVVGVHIFMVPVSEGFVYDTPGHVMAYGTLCQLD